MNELGPSRSYTLTLSPHLIYSQSALLPKLVSSRLHTQLEFQAVGSWWIYKDGIPDASQSGVQNSEETIDQGERVAPVSQSSGMLQKIPSTREDVFADGTLSPREKRSLMKFLRSVLVEPRPETHSESVPPLSTQDTLHHLARSLQRPILALSLSYDSAGAIKTTSIVPRVRRHMRSIGAFGPGFGAVMPKYGGGAEIAQVACRASAVGGAIYVLGRGLKKISDSTDNSAEGEMSRGELISLELSDGDSVKARFVTGCLEDFPTDMPRGPLIKSNNDLLQMVHSISIVSSPLEKLFPQTSESGPVPAGAVVVYAGDEDDPSQEDSILKRIPIYMIIHSSESGECPTGQCESDLLVRSVLFLTATPTLMITSMNTYLHCLQLHC